jgi:hypothetical protein
MAETQETVGGDYSQVAAVGAISYPDYSKDTGTCLSFVSPIDPWRFQQFRPLVIVPLFSISHTHTQTNKHIF